MLQPQKIVDLLNELSEIDYASVWLFFNRSTPCGIQMSERLNCKQKEGNLQTFDLEAFLNTLFRESGYSCRIEALKGETLKFFVNYDFKQE